ncbi:MAG TPA: cyclopropane-fatty-acyl-phospholipid synthase family protein [Nocardioidaceae bacterium]|nr:cyclopropane-fatty-acyl-phospholipid synthase family protein [Nocardioidaceae bacterium]
MTSTATGLASTFVVDAGRWPDVARVPDRPLRAAIARRLTRRAVRRLPIRVLLPDGTNWGGGHADDHALQLVRPDAFFRRVGSGGLIGFGEAYQAGDWDSDDLAGLLTIMAGELSTLIPTSLQRLRRAAVHRRPDHQDNTVDGARDNIHRHYDLSNELFSLFLDESMTYSSALFEGDPTIGHPDGLTTAQHRKIDRLLDIACVREGARVLEIGTGWGELAIRAAARGAHVTTVTISVEQAALARERIADAGLSERVEVRLQDYREVDGEFDAIVSCEMIEAVGWNHWPTYFGALDRLLAPGGRVGLQAITMPHDRMLATRDTYTWIVKYIFPGGHLPSVEAVHEQVAATSLQVTDELHFGQHYAETLKRWRRTFLADVDEVQALGFDDVFHRMWSLYLAYSEAGFRSGYLDVVQFGLGKPALYLVGGGLSFEEGRMGVDQVLARRSA